MDQIEKIAERHPLDERTKMKALPKWPQMRVVGRNITPEQAKEVIFRTDEFMTDTCRYSGGNNHEFNAAYRRMAGLDGLDSSDDFQSMMGRFDIERKIREKVGFIDLSYIQNNWASCSFIFGAHGWCHPDGTLFYQDNVGKWPSMEVLTDDWSKVAVAFPFLDLHAMFMSGESCEDGTQVVFSLRVLDGKVCTNDDHDAAMARWERACSSRHTRIYLKRNENGLPSAWMDEYAARVRSAVNCIRR